MAITNVFSPTFGNKPQQFVGRQQVIERFIEGLAGNPGHPHRATLFVGQRGMGKTALLLELADRAQARGFMPVRVTANKKMLDNLIEKTQLQGAHLLDRKKPIKGISAGALGFSFGLTFSDEIQNNYGFQTKLALLCEEINRRGMGILFLVDEVRSTSDEVQEFATAYQELVGDGMDVAVAMAGLPDAISSVLNDRVLTFLNRAEKEQLGELPLAEVSAYYLVAFQDLHIDIDATSIDAAAAATQGYPYLLQLIGYNIVDSVGEDRMASSTLVDLAILNSKRALVDNLYAPVLRLLSKEDRRFLAAMAKDEGASRVSDIRSRLKASASHVQTYKSRLIEAGAIASPGRGELEFAIPYLGEHLKGSI
ncbi:MAG: ATP-binding protein [Coriobacteriales bacterium]|nr:ATP-binding protein [Coriobacteriales bacterium]